MNKSVANSAVSRRSKTRVKGNIGSDTSLIKYHVLGTTSQSIAGTGNSTDFAGYRLYCPGNTAGLIGEVPAIAICSYYSTGVFRPGTMIRWVPSINFTVSGRMLCGFTDNPEVISSLVTLWQAYNTAPNSTNLAQYRGAVRQLGTLTMFPLNTEKTLALPTRLRRKRFDTNRSLTEDSIDQNDRSTQVAFFYVSDGVVEDPGSSFGSFEYHDVVSVEGITARLT
nr:hypothetical protein [Tolivirales sp.]